VIQVTKPVLVVGLTVLAIVVNQNLDYKKKLLLLVLVAFGLTISLPFFIDISWHAWIIIPLLCYITKGFGSEIGAHRLWSHRSFETSTAYKKLMVALQTLAGEGSIIGFVGVHRLHHLYSDTEKDPHCPKRGILRSTFYQHQVEGLEIRLIKDLFSEPWLAQQHKRYFKIQTALFVLLALTSPLLLWYYSVNVLSTLWINFLVNVVCHTWGSNPNQMSNNSKNNRLADVFLLGVGLHNNHHLRPGASDLAWPPYKLDIWGKIISKIQTKNG
jgi:sn-1 stearoyl-lipid 9-desaturase